MSGIKKILEQVMREPANVRFGNLQKVCEAHFGKPRDSGGSHLILRTPMAK